MSCDRVFFYNEVMFPHLLQIGPVTLYTYGFFIAFGCLTGMKLAMVLAAREGYGGKKIEESFYSLLLIMVVSGLIVARLFHVLIFWREFSGGFWGIFKLWEGGLVSYGGLLGSMIGFYFWSRKNPSLPWKSVLDWLAPGITFGHALGRMGCFFAGCCYGTPTDGFWGVVFRHPHSLAPREIQLHPTQIYEMTYLLILGTFLLWRSGFIGQIKRKIPGLVFVDYLILYSLGRFSLGFFRGDDFRVLALTPGQMGSIILFLGAICFRLIYNKSQNALRNPKGIAGTRT